ncbi:hypothetical protein [Streptomyces sp. NPDC012756]|uniref:hypothetical protein n=1 Tax=Streptomyces sp. NPDC012756 TaxID=3364847 RepID=UPI00367466B7
MVRVVVTPVPGEVSETVTGAFPVIASIVWPVIRSLPFGDASQGRFSSWIQYSSVAMCHSSSLRRLKRTHHHRSDDIDRSQRYVLNSQRGSSAMDARVRIAATGRSATMLSSERSGTPSSA